MLTGVALIGALVVTTGAQCSPEAEGNESLDETTELQQMFDNMKPGETLTLGQRTYRHSGVLRLRVANARIAGDGATLMATNDETSAVRIEADGVSVDNLQFAASATGKRWHGLDQHKLVVEADSTTVRDVTVTGSAASGVFVNGASNFILDHIVVRRSRADGIHMTNGSINGRVYNPATEWTGDDGVAVVSYGNEQPCRNIVVSSPVIRGTTWGRGISVVGGENVAYWDISVSDTNAAGVYVASEGDPYYTLSTNNIDIRGGTVTGANTNPEVAQGGILVYSAHAGKSVSNVSISDLTLASAPASARVNAAITLDQGTIRNIDISDIALLNNSQPALYTSPMVTSDDYSVAGWSRDGTPIPSP